MITVDELRQRFKADAERAVKRLFGDQPASQNRDDILAIASLVELALEDGSVKGENAALLADEAAHLLCDAFDLISQPGAATYELAMLAATLFAQAGYEAKATTLLQKHASIFDAADYAITVDGLTSLMPMVLDAYSVLVRRNIRSMRSVAASLGGLPNLGVVGHEGRYAFVLSRLLGDIGDYCSSLSGTRPSTSSIRGKARLLLGIAAEISSAPLLELSSRISSVIDDLIGHALLATVEATKSPHAMEWLSVFVRGDVPVYTLWPGQRATLEAGILSSGDSFVASLPTSAGKTLLAELKIAQFLSISPDKLVIHVAPYNALASQARRQFDERFASTSIGPSTLWTGAFEIDLRRKRPDHILITTPEKLDSIFRRARLGIDENCSEIIDRLGLLIIDEVHMVGQAGRGLALELLIMRLRRAFPSLPILALSAVAGNPEQLGEWLGGGKRSASKSTWAPTRRQVVVLQRDGTLEDVAGNELLKLKKVTDLAATAAQLATSFIDAAASPTLVFCTRRDYAESIVGKLSDGKLALPEDGVSIEARQLAERIEVDYPGEFQSLSLGLRHGIAYHHAGVPHKIRFELEAITRAGHLKAVCATTTLAEGVHLPFRSVIVPYLSFLGDEYIDPGLLRNIIGRGGRAYSNVRATIVLVAPESKTGRDHLKDEMIPYLDDPGPITSQLPAVREVVSDRQGLANKLRLEDQLMASIIDADYDDDPDTLFLGTLGKLQSASLSKATQFARNFYAYREDLEPIFLSRNSPLSLTPIGKVAAVSGLSARSIVLIRDYLLGLPADHAWFEIMNWTTMALSSEILSVIADLSVMAYEYIDNCIRKDRYHEKKLAALVDANGVSEILSATILDRAILSRWLQGMSTAQLLASLEADSIPLQKGVARKDAGIETWLIEILNHRQQTNLWILSAGLRLSRLMCEENNRPSPPFPFGVNMVKYGLPSFRAAQLADIGIERDLCLRLADALDAADAERFGRSLRDRALHYLRSAMALKSFESSQLTRMITALSGPPMTW